jgi:hypothetical protein
MQQDQNLVQSVLPQKRYAAWKVLRSTRTAKVMVGLLVGVALLFVV